jgi:hypothetical protein
MRQPRVWYTVRQALIAMAIVVGLAIVHSQLLTASAPIYVAVSAAVAGVFALGAMRRPIYFLAIAVLLWAVLPRVSDSSAHELFGGCYTLGWTLGALAGTVIRTLRKAWAAPPIIRAGTETVSLT